MMAFAVEETPKFRYVNVAGNFYGKASIYIVQFSDYTELGK